VFGRTCIKRRKKSDKSQRTHYWKTTSKFEILPPWNFAWNRPSSVKNVHRVECTIFRQFKHIQFYLYRCLNDVLKLHTISLVTIWVLHLEINTTEKHDICVFLKLSVKWANFQKPTVKIAHFPRKLVHRYSLHITNDEYYNLKQLCSRCDNRQTLFLIRTNERSQPQLSCYDLVTNKQPSDQTLSNSSKTQHVCLRQHLETLDVCELNGSVSYSQQSSHATAFTRLWQHLNLCLHLQYTNQH